MDVLLLLAAEPSGLSAAEIAAKLDLPKSTSHHLLNVMLDRGFVSRATDSNAWTLGISAYAVGTSYLRGDDLPRTAAPFLIALSREHDATAHLAVLSNTDVVYISKEEPSGQGPRLVTDVGMRLPAHLTAVGRALLIDLDEDELTARFSKHAMQQRTAQGPRDIDQLTDILEEVRQDGYADERGATTPGIRCLAAPIRVAESSIAAVGLTFVDGTRSDDELSRMAAGVQDTARAIGTALANNHELHDSERSAARAG